MIGGVKVGDAAQRRGAGARPFSRVAALYPRSLIRRRLPPPREDRLPLPP